MTSVIFAGNGSMAVGILNHLCSDTVDIEALLLHPEDDPNYVAKNTEELMSLVDEAPVIRGNEFRDGKEYEQLAETNLDFLVCAGFGYIFHESDLLGLSNERAINVHTSMLPKNRGRHTGRWPIINDDPAGVTIHELTPGIDEGAILAQTEVEYDLTYSSGDLYSKMYQEGVDLFVDTWEDIKSGEITEKPQNEDVATYNAASDLDDYRSRLQSQTFTLEEFVRGIQALDGEIELETADQKYAVKLTVEDASASD